MRTVFLSCVAVVVVAGCGGGESSEVDLTGLAACLGDELPTHEVSRDQGDLDLPVRGEGLQLLSSDNDEVEVVVEPSSSDADNLEAGYDSFNLGQVERYGTVVVASNQAMDSQVQDAIEHCLGDQGVE